MLCMQINKVVFQLFRQYYDQ